MTKDNRVKPEKEIISQIKAMSKKFEVKIDDLKERFYDIYYKPYMNQFKETDRQKHSVRILLAKLTAEHDRKSFSGSTTPVIIRVEGKEPVSTFRRQDGTESYRSAIYVTVKNEDEIGFGTLTLWGDANELHPSLTVGETYATRVVIGRTEPYDMSMNSPEELEDSDEELPPAAEIITKYYDPIDIKEMEFNISKDWNQKRLVQGTVTGSWMKLTKNNTNMGFLKIIGDDPDEQTVVKFSRSPEQVNLYGEGSYVYCLGQITPATLNDQGEEQYPCGQWGDLIIPVMAVPVDSDEDDEASLPGEDTIEDKEVTDDDIIEDLDSW